MVSAARAGALGMRTVHQADPKAQLLVRVGPGSAVATKSHTAAAGDDDDGSGDEAASLDAALAGGAADNDLKVVGLCLGRLRDILWSSEYERQVRMAAGSGFTMECSAAHVDLQG